MKSFTFKLILSLCFMLGALAMLMPDANAAVKYWDGNGDTAGAGAAPAGTWSTSAFWSTASDGTATPAVWISGDDAVFSAGTDATGAFTVTLGSATAGSISLEEGTVSLGGTGAVTLGAGDVTISSGAVLSTSSSARISATAGSVMTINGGTVRTTNPGSAGSFVDIDQVIVLGTGGGTIDYTVPNVLNIVQTTTIISGTGPLTKEGVGVLAIASPCTYSGATIINNGELRIRGSANRLPTGTDVTINSPGILNLNSVAGSGAVGQQVASLSGDGTVGLGNSVLVIGGSGTATFSGSISNTANAGAAGSTSTSGNGVTKQGTGTQTFSGPNGFTGLLTLTAGALNVSPTGMLCDPVCDVIVNGGTLSLTNTAQGIENLGGTGGVIILNSGHTLTINPINTARSVTFLGAITGPGAIEKIGATTEFLLGANTYSGPTTVSVGKLVMSPASTGAGSFTVADNATLGTQMLTPGTTFNLSDLTYGNATAEFDFNSLGYPSATMLHDVGAITVNGTVPVNVKGFNTAGGPVTLLDYAGARSGAGSFTTGVLPPRIVGTVTDDTANSRVTFQATGSDSLVWVSDVTGTWDVNNSGNSIWKLASDSSATYYQETAVQGDTVRFDDTAAVTGTATVTIPAATMPFRIIVDNSTTNYTFTGVGKITGVGTLTKNGTGSLIIESTNDYSGGTTLNAGTIATANNSPLGTGKLTINGGAIRADTTARTISVPVDLNANLTLGDSVNNGDLTFSTGAWMITGGNREINVDSINATINSVVGQDVAGRGLTKNGNGILSLGGANAFSGGFSHNAGTVRVNSTTALGAANSPVSYADGVTLSTTAGTGRTLTYVHTINGNVTLGQAVGGTAAVTLAGWIDLAGAARTITIANTTDTISGVISNGSLIKAGSGALILASPTNTYSGTTTINAGTLSVDGDGRMGDGTGTVILNGGNLNASADRNSEIVPNPISIQADGAITTTSTAAAADFRFSNSSITPGAGVKLTLRNDGADGAADVFEVYFSAGGLSYAEEIIIDNGAVGKTRLNFFNTNTDPVQTFSGVISGNGSINRSASVAGTGGTTILSGNNTYSGGTTVGRGTLLVNNTTGSGTGTGTVTVNSGGILGGTGTVGGDVVVNSGGIIGAGASAGILTINSGLDLSAGGTNVWELAANSTNNAGTDFDQISLTGGNLVLGGASHLLVKFTGSASFPDSTNVFWQTNRSWLVIAGSGSAANPTATNFATVDGVAGNNAGSFATTADANGNVYLNFTPGVVPPPPVIDPNIVGAGTTNAQISWSSVAGASYTVQYKTNLNQVGWLDLTNLIASGITTAIVDNTSPVPVERYYRVISP
jgi:fibronectin-binding autotransporter adhesin